MITYNFDSAKPNSILAQAEKVRGKSLRDVLTSKQVTELKGFYKDRKGYLGDMVEQYVFNKNPDTSPNPDFPDAVVELKTTGLRRSGNKYVAKERLVFGMINYMKIIDETWPNSSFLRKSSLFLLMAYEFDEDIPPIDYKFRIIKMIDLLTDLPPRDLRQIQDDWESIVDKIIAGKAHEISEGDTIYLGACTKGKTAKDRTRQPHADEMAMPRALALKAKYLTYLINEGNPEVVKEYGSIFESPTDNIEIEDVILERFARFIGRSDSEIATMLSVELNPNAKSYHSDMARAMLGIRKRRIAELEKADISMKITRLQKNGVPKESMPFPAINYLDIVEEEWETSTWLEMLSRKFLFVVFQYRDDGVLIFRGAKFWNIPFADLEHHAKPVWRETVKRINNGRADNLPKISFDPVCHVRPHGRDSSDTSPTPDGRMVAKKSFWLNAAYIAKQVGSLP